MVGGSLFWNYEGRTKTLSRRENNYQLLYSFIGRSRSFGGKRRSGKSNEHRPELGTRDSPNSRPRKRRFIIAKSYFKVRRTFRVSRVVGRDKNKKERKEKKIEEGSQGNEVSLYGRDSGDGIDKVLG